MPEWIVCTIHVAESDDLDALKWLFVRSYAEQDADSWAWWFVKKIAIWAWTSGSVDKNVRAKESLLIMVCLSTGWPKRIDERHWLHCIGHQILYTVCMLRFCYVRLLWHCYNSFFFFFSFDMPVWNVHINVDPTWYTRQTGISLTGQTEDHVNIMIS